MAKGLHEIENSRLFRFREKLSPYRFTIHWAPEKTHQIANAFSRHPVFCPQEAEDTTKAAILFVATDSALQPLYDAATEGEEYQKLHQAVLKDKRLASLRVNHPARTYRSVYNDLSTSGPLAVLWQSSKNKNAKTAHWKPICPVAPCWG